jgi:hypothetical protein
VLDPELDDYGAAYPGFLILDPKHLAAIKSTAVKLWIHAHECGHQFRGPDEETADCFAVQRGRRQGWLTPEGLDEICKFMAPAKGDNMHFTGTQRCQAMKQCYADRSVHREEQGPPCSRWAGPRNATKEMHSLDMRFAARCQPSD